MATDTNATVANARMAQTELQLADTAANAEGSAKLEASLFVATARRCDAFDHADVVGHLLSFLYYPDTSMLAQTDNATRIRVREAATFLHIPLYCLPELAGGDWAQFQAVWPACKAARLERPGALLSHFDPENDR
jgi:hypothetical protein